MVINNNDVVVSTQCVSMTDEQTDSETNGTVSV